MTAAVAPGGVREVLRLAWPAILSSLLQNAYRINDQLWVRPLGTEALAADFRVLIELTQASSTLQMKLRLPIQLRHS